MNPNDPFDREAPFANPFGVRRPRVALPDPLVSETEGGGQLIQTPGGTFALTPGLGSELINQAPTIVTPSRIGWWSGDNTIGKALPRQAYPNLVGGKIPVLNVSEFGIPQMLTVALNRETTLGQTSPNNADVFARVEFGIGAMADALELDWGNSVQFSVVCSSIRVFAVSEVATPLTAYAPIATEEVVQLAAGAGEKALGTSALPPTRTIRFARTAAGIAIASTAGAFAVIRNIQIPAFAKSFFVTASASAVATVNNVFMDGALTVGCFSISNNPLFRLTGLELQNFVPIPLPANATTLRLTSNAYPFAPADVLYSIVFQLGL